MDIPVTFRADVGVPPLSPQASEEILRAVHEALTNVRRHAEASSAKVVLDADDQMVRVSIEDDGRGIPPGAAERSTGYGLTSMRQRVESIGGQLRLESHGWGTRVIVQVPIEAFDGVAPATSRDRPPADRVDPGDGDEVGSTRDGLPDPDDARVIGRREPRAGAWLRTGANVRGGSVDVAAQAGSSSGRPARGMPSSPASTRSSRKPDQSETGSLTDETREESSRT